MQRHHDRAASEILRGIRGSRSQVAFSRRLGFRSNVAAKWESGQRLPTAAKALLYSQRAGMDVTAALRAFHPASAGVLVRVDAMHVAKWLDALRGTQTLAAIAARARLSRFSVGRFLAGRSQPRLSQFLDLIDALTDRLPDFVHAWVGISRVPSLAPRYERVSAARDAMFNQPLCLAVMCLLDTAALDRPEPIQIKTIAKTLARPAPVVRASIETLLRGKIVTKARDRYRLTGSFTVDGNADPLLERQARAFWARSAMRRMRAPGPNDLFSYNVFSVSRADYEKLQQLQREFFRGARALVAASEPTEVAGLLLVQLLSWEPLP